MVIGTAGHIDHGKTALVRALTGQDTDRLPEERSRGISIDLGFAHFRLPGGRMASVVDVPGHERFIRNMLAGATGIDMVLLVVAADEGVMPQTREHLDILGLLELSCGVVALTKVDLVEPEWLDLMEEEVRGALSGTFLEGAPMVRVSAVTGQGIPELAQALDRVLPAVPPRDLSAFARLPIDRVFTVPGFGTVVTGTLRSGRIRVEDRLELLPGRRAVRVRGLQVHGAPVEEAGAGQRVAVNLAGVDREEVSRGHVLAPPGCLSPASLFSARLRLLPGARRLANNTRVHLHTGTSEVLARVLLLDREELAPGEEAFARLKTETPLVAGSGDQYILRSYSPTVTIGGGRLLEAGVRRRRFAARDLAELALREAGDPRQLALARIVGGGIRPVAVAELTRTLGLEADERDRILASLAAEGAVLALEGGYYLSREGLGALGERLRSLLEEFARSNPLKRGMGRGEVHQRLLPGLDPKVFAQLLSLLRDAGLVELERERVGLPGRAPQLSPAQERARELLRQRFREAGFAPPDAAQATADLPVSPRQGEDLLQHLVEEGELVKVGDAFWHRGNLAEATRRLQEVLAQHGRITAADFRNLLGTSRKYAVPLLEYFDGIKLTRREGDYRVPFRR